MIICVGANWICHMMNIDFAQKSLESAKSLFMCTYDLKLHHVTALTFYLYGFTVTLYFVEYI